MSDTNKPPRPENMESSGQQGFPTTSDNSAASPVRESDQIPSCAVDSQSASSAQSAQCLNNGAQATQPKKRNRVWIIVLGVIAAIVLTFAMSIYSCSSMLSGFMSEDDPYAGHSPENTIGVVSLTGEIGYDGSISSPAGFRKMLEMAEEDPNIKALVIRVNSGGGSATAGEEMAEALQRFSKPVVISSASLNASAAYMISAQAQYIFVAKTTEIGAIGTGMTFTDLSGLYEKLGIKKEDITSTPNKDSSWGNRSLTPEEREYYQNMVHEINSCFIDLVAQGRGLEKAQVENLATGLTFTGMTAVKNGVADEIGYLHNAEAKAAELAELSEWNAQELHLKSSNPGLDLLDLVGFGEYKEFNELKKELGAHDLYSK